MRARISRVASAITIGAIALGTIAMSQSARAADPVIFSFSTVGDSRQDNAAPDASALLPAFSGSILPQDHQWLQNTQAFSEILRNIQSQKPQLLFFNGDMIYGYGSPVPPAAWATTNINGQQSATLPNTWNTPAASVSPDFVFEYIQYAFWRGMVAPLFNTGTYVIPVPGNHETQCSPTASPYGSGAAANPSCTLSASTKHAYPANESAFIANMGDLVEDLVTNQRFSTVTKVPAANVTNVSGLTTASAPQTGGNNGPITTSQAYLSYSFDIQTTLPSGANGPLLHFAVINTDPSGADNTAPTDWLAADFATALTRGTTAGVATKFFVFGHKPAKTYNYTSSSTSISPAPAAGGLDSNANAAYVQQFIHVLAQYNATYFSGHEHTVNVQQLTDTTASPSPNKPFQVIVGSGGSPFDDKLTGTCPGSASICLEPANEANPTDRYYAWATVQIHQSGNVTLSVSGFSDTYQPVQSISYYNVPGSVFTQPTLQ
jgi:hypothetical protein